MGDVSCCLPAARGLRVACPRFAQARSCLSLGLTSLGLTSFGLTSFGLTSLGLTSLGLVGRLTSVVAHVGRTSDFAHGYVRTCGHVRTWLARALLARVLLARVLLARV